MAYLKLPRSFFIKERDSAYSDWEQAIFRELIQNSRDANATNISFETSRIPGGQVRLTCTDDGSGMTRETLENVYFRLGESSKDFDTSVGGFGRARILIPFSFDKYTLMSSDYVVNGSGAEYEVSQMDDSIAGVFIEVVSSDTSISTLESRLREYAGTCSLEGIHLQLNGDPVDLMTQDLGEPSKSFFKDEGYRYADVYYFPEKECNVLVRVNGLTMFTMYNPLGKGLFIFEIHPSALYPVFNSSRDSLQYWAGRDFAEFMTSVAVDTKTALRPKKTTFHRTFKGTGSLKAEAPHGGSQIKVHKAHNPSKAFRETLVQEVRIAEECRASNLVDTQQTPTTEAGNVFLSARKTHREYTVSEFISDLPILVDTDNQELINTVDNYDPSNWKFQIKGDKPVWKNCHHEIHLLLSWQEAIRQALKSLNSTGNRLSEDLEYLVGWQFTDDTQASTKTVDGIRNFYLSPVTSTGKKRFDLRKKLHAQTICSMACHEVAHLVCSYHNEDFSVAHTNIVSNFDWDTSLHNILSIKF